MNITTAPTHFAHRPTHINQENDIRHMNNSWPKPRRGYMVLHDVTNLTEEYVGRATDATPVKRQPRGTRHVGDRAVYPAAMPDPREATGHCHPPMPALTELDATPPWAQAQACDTPHLPAQGPPDGSYELSSFSSHLNRLGSLGEAAPRTLVGRRDWAQVQLRNRIYKVGRRLRVRRVKQGLVSRPYCLHGNHLLFLIP